MTEIEKKVVVIYTGDETNARRKIYGKSIIEQMLMSVKSIRQNWSHIIEIIFVHTESLTSYTTKQLDIYGVKPIHSKRKIEPRYPISNKILSGLVYQGNKHILFLDSDTYIHQPLDFEIKRDMLVAFDALQGVPKKLYKQLFENAGVKFPSGHFSLKPAYDYYYTNKKLFPMWNAGVYFIQNKLIDIFYPKLEQNFHKTFDFLSGKIDFYYDQTNFCLTVHQLGIKYYYFAKGYNFICTPRAPYLRNWPKENIFLEHYAGDNSKALQTL